MSQIEQKLRTLFNILIDVPPTLSLKLFQMATDQTFNQWMINQPSDEPPDRQIQIYKNRQTQIYDGIMLTLGYLAQYKTSSDQRELDYYLNNKESKYGDLERLIDQEYLKYHIMQADPDHD